MNVFFRFRRQLYKKLDEEQGASLLSLIALSFKPFTSVPFIPSANCDECYTRAQQIFPRLHREQSGILFDHSFSFERVFYKLRFCLCAERPVHILDNLSKYLDCAVVLEILSTAEENVLFSCLSPVVERPCGWCVLQYVVLYAVFEQFPRIRRVCIGFFVFHIHVLFYRHIYGNFICAQLRAIFKYRSPRFSSEQSNQA